MGQVMSLLNKGTVSPNLLDPESEVHQVVEPSRPVSTTCQCFDELRHDAGTDA